MGKVEKWGCKHRQGCVAKRKGWWAMEKYKAEQIKQLYEMNPERWNPLVLAGRFGVDFRAVLVVCGERARDYYQKAAVAPPGKRVTPPGKRVTQIRRKMQRSGLERNLWVRCDGPRLMQVEQMASGFAGRIVRLPLKEMLVYESNLYLTDQDEPQAILLHPGHIRLLPIIRAAAHVKKYGVADFGESR